MKNLTLLMIAVWSFIGLAIIAAIIFVTLFFNNSGEGVFTMMAFGETNTSDMQIVAEEKVPMIGIDKIELEFFADNCNVYFTDGENIEMKHYARNIPQGRYARADVFGGTLQISTRPQGLEGFSPFGFMSRSNVDIFLPEAYKEALSVSLASGNLSFGGDINLNGLSIKISSGDIRTDHAVDARNLEVTVTSGSVKLLGGVKADRYALKTSSGNLSVGDTLAGSGSVNVTSGTIKLAGVDITESLNLKVSSGDINIGLAGNPSLQFSGKKTSGDLRTYFDLNKDGSHFSATIGEAPYKSLDVQVTSGTIRITQD